MTGLGLAAGAFASQAILMAIDELHFHRERGLPRWERAGHPLDTLSVLACWAMIWFFPFDPSHLKIYIVLAAFSCVLVTKDEWQHSQRCPAGEHWVHAMLFVLHPVVLGAAAWLWPSIQGSSDADTAPRALFFAQTLLSLSFWVYQILYWNVYAKRASGKAESQ